MPVKPCFNQPFVGTQQFEIPYGSTITTLTRGTKVGGPFWIMEVCRRPIVPIWGVTLNMATGTYDFVPSTKGNEQALIAIAQSSLQASINYVRDLNGFEIYTTGEYGDYLYNKVASSTCLLNRYLETYNKAAQFFRLHAAIPTFDLPIYKELTDLAAKVMAESDKQMFIPPGSYTFDTGSLATAALEAWRTADPTFQNLYSIELVTT